MVEFLERFFAPETVLRILEVAARIVQAVRDAFEAIVQAIAKVVGTYKAATLSAHA